jgi:hypothetical protein
MTFRAIAFLLSVFILSACAKKPGDIRPVYVPITAYSGQPCKDLQETIAKERTALDTLMDEQSRAASTDAFFVATLGVPMASATGGDKETEIAASLGRVQALRGAIAQKKCPPPDDQTN